MKRRQFLKSSLIAGCTFSSLSFLQQKALGVSQCKKPNILFIMTDQQHSEMMSCAGNPYLKTPAMDNLAAAGIRFEQAYATNPVCVPSRFSLQTGQYPSAIGVRHNGSKPSSEMITRLRKQALGSIFRENGYKTVYGGKVHLPGEMNDIKNCGYEQVLTTDERGELAQMCADFLKQQGQEKNNKGRKPFLLFASFINPHDICYMGINEFRNSQGREAVDNIDSRTCDTTLAKVPVDGREEFIKKNCPPLPKNFEPTKGEPQAIRNLLSRRKFRIYEREKWSQDTWRLHRWLYCRLTEMVDAEIDMVLSALRQAGLEDETLIVFTSDHGDLDSAHRMEHKTFFYEQATRVPFIIAYKNKTKPGSVNSSHLVSNGLDLLPTLCDYAGITPPADIPGRSLKQLAQGNEPQQWRDDLLIENQIGNLVLTKRYKYASYKNNDQMLIDLDKDPGEMVNVAKNPEYADILKDMKKRLRKHLQRINSGITI
ncbi:MAG: sulfatase family protein [Planctomycetota bacterium]